MALKRIVCLANSIKQGGNCFAGVELLAGQASEWVRPIGASSGHGVSEAERQLQDGAEPRPLEIVVIGTSGPAPSGHQAENWALDASVGWQKTGTWGFDDLELLEDCPTLLWPGVVSSSVGINDRVPAELLEPLGTSIYLIHPDDVEVHVERNPYGRRDIEVRAQFNYSGTRHLTKISDPVYKDWYLAQGIGTYPLEDAYLTVSLAEPWAAPGRDDVYAYIVVAAVIEPFGTPGN